MAGFKKAKSEQAAIKMAIYGPPGSGKTFTSLLLGEGLAKKSNKKMAFVDTERGTDFYSQEVKQRTIHPEAFDFEAIYTKSMMEVLEAVKGLDPKEYGVLVIDSITHLWEACIAAYSGKQTKASTIPFHAWGRIKKPYKDLMAYLISSPMHVIFCGRQGTEYATNEETEEMKAIGFKMKAEGETPYEPHILIRMEAIKPKKTNELATIVAYAEKDRTGILAGRSFVNPTFESICAPILYLLGETQAQMSSTDETASVDAEKLADQEEKRIQKSYAILEEYCAKISLAKDDAELKEVGKKITPFLKAQMTTSDVESLRARYVDKDRQINGNL